MLASHMMHLMLLRVQLETFISKVRSTRDFREEKHSWWVAIEKMVGKAGTKEDFNPNLKSQTGEL